MVDRDMINKMLSSKCTPTELDALQHHLAGQDQESIEQMLQENWEKAKEVPPTISHGLEERIWDGIERKRNAVNTPKLRVVSRRRSIAVAASIALLVTLAGWGWWSSTSGIAQMVEVENNQLAPKALQLSDGSTVWLRTGSRLSYLRSFEKDARHVSLKGEAFFEVSKDTDRPFIVTTEDLQTEVLGTQFNVRSGAQSIVALKEGKVQVRAIEENATVILLPGEEVVYDQLDGEMQKNTSIADQPYAWRDEVIFFNKADVFEVASTIEKWYGINITVNEKERITGRLVYRFDTKELSLEEVLEGIGLVMDYQFEQQVDGSYVIKSK